MIETIGRGVLNRQELPRISVVLHVTVGFDEQLVAGHESATPTSHVEAFAGRVEFDADLFGAGSRQKAQRFAFEYQSCVGGVMNDHDAIASGKLDYFGEEFGRGARARWVVRIVNYKDL